MNQITKKLVNEKTVDTLKKIGNKIKELRSEKNLTLRTLAEITGISPSMLSLLERGKSAPSIGSLVLIATALDAQMNDLLEEKSEVEDQIVSYSNNQKVYSSSLGVTRRILKNERSLGVELAINEYNAKTHSNSEPKGHKGYEFGVVLEGKIQLQLEDNIYILNQGDTISYDSRIPHKIINSSKSKAKALWVNLKNGKK